MNVYARRRPTTGGGPCRLYGDLRFGVVGRADAHTAHRVGALAVEQQVIAPNAQSGGPKSREPQNRPKPRAVRCEGWRSLGLSSEKVSAPDGEQRLADQLLVGRALEDCHSKTTGRDGVA